MNINLVWAKEINNWFHKELKEYMKNPKDGGITKKRKAHNIINYTVPGYNKDITIVYADNLKNGNGVHINKNVIETFVLIEKDLNNEKNNSLRKSIRFQEKNMAKFLDNFNNMKNKIKRKTLI